MTEEWWATLVRDTIRDLDGNDLLSEQALTESIATKVRINLSNGAPMIGLGSNDDVGEQLKVLIANSVSGRLESDGIGGTPSQWPDLVSMDVVEKLKHMEQFWPDEAPPQSAEPWWDD